MKRFEYTFFVVFVISLSIGLSGCFLKYTDRTMNQNTVCYSLRVVDFETEQPIELAHVLISDGFRESERGSSDIDGKIGISVPFGVTRLRITKEGYGDGFYKPSGDDDLTSEILISLFREAVVYGSVRSGDGTIAKNRTVNLSNLNRDIRWTSSTDEMGNFTFRNIPSGQSLTIELGISDWFSQHETIPYLEPGQRFGPVDLILCSEGILSGYVYDGTSKRALPNIKLELKHHNSDWNGHADTMSDECGYFEFTHVPFGSVMVCAVSDQHWNQWSSSVIINSSQPESHVQLYLPPPATLAGRIIRGEGFPVDNIWVTLKDSNESSSAIMATAITDINGNFIMTLKRQPSAESIMEFKRDDRTLWSEKAMHYAQGKVPDILPGKEVKAEFRFNDLPFNIYGTVNDVAGHPLKNATVRIMTNLWTVSHETTTDEFGYYEFVHPIINGLDSAYLIIYAPDFQKQRRNLSEDSHGESGYQINVELEAALVISGRITSQSGIPLNGFIIQAILQKNAMNEYIESPLYQDTCDSTGAFVFDNLRNGQYKISVRMAGSNICSYELPSEITSGTLNLEIACPKMESLVLTVADLKTQAPITDYIATSTNLTEDSSIEMPKIASTAYVNAQTGRCRFNYWSSARQKLIITSRDATSRHSIFNQMILHESDNRDRTTLTISGPTMENVLTGIVIDQITHLPVPGINLVINPQNGRMSCLMNSYITKTNSEGQFHLNYFEPGIYNIKAWTEIGPKGIIRYSETKHLDFGNFEIQVKPMTQTSLYGKVVDSETGNPVEAVTISITGNQWSEATSDRDGLFEIKRITSEELSISCCHDGYDKRILPGVVVKEHADPETALTITLTRRGESAF